VISRYLGLCDVAASRWRAIHSCTGYRYLDWARRKCLGKSHSQSARTKRPASGEGYYGVLLLVVIDDLTL